MRCSRIVDRLLLAKQKFESELAKVNEAIFFFDDCKLDDVMFENEKGRWMKYRYALRDSYWGPIIARKRRKARRLLSEARVSVSESIAKLNASIDYATRLGF